MYQQNIAWRCWNMTPYRQKERPDTFTCQPAAQPPYCQPALPAAQWSADYEITQLAQRHAYVLPHAQRFPLNQSRNALRV